MSKKRLGKGLNALIPNNPTENDATEGTKKITEIKIEEIEANPYQPRKEFDEDQLKELSQSIKEHGVIQPISVRKIGNKYQLIAGERRLRASKLAKLETIPAIEKDLDEKQMMEIALIENLQREDLNPIEEALAYQQLMSQFGLTQDEVSNRVSKSRSTIANTVRLLKLPDEIQEIVSRETISMGHARALLALDTKKEMIQVCNKCIQEVMTVRQLEDHIKQLKEKKDNIDLKKRKVKNPELKKLESNLTEQLGTRVRISESKEKKTISIECRDGLDFERILDLLISD